MVFPAREWILYSDDALLAVNKPAGLPALPDGYHPDAPHVKRVLEPGFGRLWIVHRLDRQTSGVMLLARSPQAHRALNDQFQSHQAIKVYHALVIGTPAWEEMVVDLPLHPDGDRRHRTVVDRAHGKPAVTRLRPIEHFACFSLVEAIPQTGRTHQLRAHLSAVGFPIVGDSLYGGGMQFVNSSHSMVKNKSATDLGGRLERLGLHACKLAIEHPIDRSKMVFEAPYPSDFELTLEFLRQNYPARLD